MESLCLTRWGWFRSLALALVVTVTMWTRAVAARADCPTGNGVDTDTGVELDLTSPEKDVKTDRKQKTSRSPQSRTWFDRDQQWAILWDGGPERACSDDLSAAGADESECPGATCILAGQRLEIFRDDPDDGWISTNIPVHDSSETEKKSRYKARADVEHRTCTLAGDELFVLTHRFTEKDPAAACGTACPMYFFRFSSVMRCEGENSPDPATATICTPSGGECTSPDACTFESYELDDYDEGEEFPVTIQANLKVEAANFAFEGRRPFVTWTEPTGATGEDVKVVVTAADDECSCSGIHPGGTTGECEFDNGAFTVATIDVDEAECADMECDGGTNNGLACDDEDDCPGGECEGECEGGYYDGDGKTCDELDDCIFWDDVSAIFASMDNGGTGGVGVLWSNQTEDDSGFYYRYHAYGGSLSTGWNTVEHAYTGGETYAHDRIGDDHISAIGNVGEYGAIAVVKTSRDDGSPKNGPMTVLLYKVEDGYCDEDECAGGFNHGEACTDDDECEVDGVCDEDTCDGGLHDGDWCADNDDCIGGWVAETITEVGSDHTRPAIVWDVVDECLYYFATDRDSNDKYEIVEQRTEFPYNVSPMLPNPSWTTQDPIMTDVGSENEANLNNVSVPKGPFAKDVIGIISSNHQHEEDEGTYFQWFIEP